MTRKSSIFLVLHQVQGPENLGAVARVIANFGISSLVLSDPQTADWDAAARRAVHSTHVLSAARQTRTLQEALAPAVYACGTTFRAQVGARHALGPEAAAERLWSREGEGPVALVLGGERRGLSDRQNADGPELGSRSTLDRA